VTPHALVVTYHAVHSAPSRVTVTRDRLLEDLLGLGDAGYTFVSLDAVADWLDGTHALPPKAASVTFDDGYASVALEALPIIDSLKIPAAVFVIAGRLGQSNRWPGQPAWVPRMALLDVAGVRELDASGVTIGSHSWSHVRLGSADDATRQREIIEAAALLEDVVQKPVRHFAYPYGEKTPRDVDLASRRFRTAVTAQARAVTPGCALHELPRLDAHDVGLASTLGLLGGRAMTPYLTLRRGLRRWLR